MTDTESPDVGADTELPTPEDAMAQLQSLFATLVPPDELDLEDALGNRYRARAVLPARAQIKVMQQLSSLWEHEIPQSLTAGDTAGVVGAIVGMAADEVVLNGISDAFAAAHPQVLAQAREAAKAGGLDATHPADLFPVEELVGGLVPFFIRFAAKAANLVATVTGQ